MGIENFSSWDGATYRSNDGSYKIKAVAARQGVTDAILRQRFGAPPSEIASRYSGGSNPNSFAPNLSDGPGEIARRPGDTSSQATLRARAAGIDPYGYDGRRDSAGNAIPRTANRAAGTGAPAGMSALPLAARAPSASMAPRYGLAVAGGPTIQRSTPASGPRYRTMELGGQADEEKAKADELAKLWDLMGEYRGTPAYEGYAARAAQIEAEQQAAQRARGIGDAAGSFGSAAASPSRFAETYPVDPSLNPTIQRTRAAVGETRQNENPDGPAITWNGTSWETDADKAAAARAAAPGPTIERRRPNPTPAPPTTSDYVPPTTSRFESTPGFDQEAYRQAYVNAQTGAVQRGYADTIARTREAYAARGLSQSGRSGAEQAAMVQAEIARDNQAGQVGADAALKSIEMGRTDAIQRAGAIDNYGLSRGGFGISYAGDNRQAKQQDVMLPLDAQIKMLEAAGIDTRNVGLQLDNAGKIIQNDHNQAIVDWYKETRAFDRTRNDQTIERGRIDNTIAARTMEDVIAQAAISKSMAYLGMEAAKRESQMAGETFDQRLAAKKAELQQAIAQGKLGQWEAENAHWLAALKFGGSLIQGAVNAAVSGGKG